MASSFDLPLSEGSIENGVITRSAVPPAISKSIAWIGSFLQTVWLIGPPLWVIVSIGLTITVTDSESLKQVAVVDLITDGAEIVAAPPPTVVLVTVSFLAFWLLFLKLLHSYRHENYRE